MAGQLATGDGGIADTLNHLYHCRVTVYSRKNSWKQVACYSQFEDTTQQNSYPS